MVLGEMIRIEPRGVIGFDQLEARFIKFVQRQITAIKMIKNSKVHTGYIPQISAVKDALEKKKGCLKARSRVRDFTIRAA